MEGPEVPETKSQIFRRLKKEKAVRDAVEKRCLSIDKPMLARYCAPGDICRFTGRFVGIFTGRLTGEFTERSPWRFTRRFTLTIHSEIH
jgi:hypothetical protein